MDKGKIAKIERLEKGLGISIDKFISIITNGFYYREGNEIYWQSNAIFIGNGYCPHSNSMVNTHHLRSEYDREDKKQITDSHYWDWARKEDVFNFEDYGKTWASTREELMGECDI